MLARALSGSRIAFGGFYIWSATLRPSSGTPACHFGLGGEGPIISDERDGHDGAEEQAVLAWICDGASRRAWSGMCRVHVVGE